MIRLFGTTYRIHPLSVLIMLISVITGSLIELLTLFAVVLVHELGHAAAANTVSWKIREIELLPFGGVLKLDDQGRSSAAKEIFVSVAGPFQNVWMIGLSWMLVNIGVWNEDWGAFFIQANLTIALFNLLPVLPLDGGRIVQAWVSCLLPYYQTLRLCGWVSIAFSSGMVAFALASIQNGVHLNLLMIGCFLVWTNCYEQKHMMYRFIRFLLHRKMTHQPNSSVLPVEPVIVPESAGVGKAVRLLRRNRYHWILVVNREGRVRSILPESEVVRRFLAIKTPEE